MPRLTQLTEAPGLAIQFVASPALDMMNAMYFTSLAPQIEGIEGWPPQLRERMAPELLAGLDFLYNYPAGDPGLMGTLGDNLFIHPEVWGSVKALVAVIEGLPDGIGLLDEAPGVQGLVYQAVFRYPDDVDRAGYEQLPHRAAIEKRLSTLDDRDAGAIMALYDRPAELRERMVALVQRFYRDHYEQEMHRRLPALERSVLLQRSEGLSDPEAIARKLTGKRESCLETVCAGRYSRYIFAPSTDMGAYNSCAIVGGVHGMFYGLPVDIEGMAVDPEETRLARLYKALGDEQRLRILRLLRGREMYAQEIVEATGLHQSVVSRHLTFMKAVGLVKARRQNNMKFFSISAGVREALAATFHLFPGETN
jgi:DNA-binding transcriptional ArsR family regulator